MSDKITLFKRCRSRIFLKAVSALMVSMMLFQDLLYANPDPKSVAEALPKQPGLAYNTVLTTMRILEDKGYVRHTKSKEGRAFLYHPVVGQKEASRNAVRRLLTRFFRNSPEELVLNLLEDEDLSEQELTRIRKRISGDTHSGTGRAK